jgi:hypothetical protein
MEPRTPRGSGLCAAALLGAVQHPRPTRATPEAVPEGSRRAGYRPRLPEYFRHDQTDGPAFFKQRRGFLRSMPENVCGGARVTFGYTLI